MSILMKDAYTRPLPVALTMLEAEAVLDLINGLELTEVQKKKLQNVKTKIRVQARILRKNVRNGGAYENAITLEELAGG